MTRRPLYRNIEDYPPTPGEITQLRGGIIVGLALLFGIGLPTYIAFIS